MSTLSSPACAANQCQGISLAKLHVLQQLLDDACPNGPDTRLVFHTDVGSLRLQYDQPSRRHDWMVHRAEVDWEIADVPQIRTYCEVFDVRSGPHREVLKHLSLDNLLAPSRRSNRGGGQ